MNYEERKRVALERITDFLGSFASPRGLSEDAQVEHIGHIADAFARRLPVTSGEEYRANIEKTFTAVRDAHTGYAWPVQSEFVAAMPKGFSAKSPAGAIEELNREKILADKFLRGDGVPEPQVWKANIVSRLGSYGLTREIVDSYRRGSVANCRSVFGAEAQPIMVERYGPAVLEYFGEVSQ